ncbi:unconventional prefoldin RPB5 interactor-like protein [Sabethes cyaneus]|uniref:unconventional prefoldin RPB5 interactor-like protein n=1 Tax=Sabethes cyaneus TaxID=53552 RepID=UPI00237E84B3|nr:unconventional prefoldin RPB5 interactor-like protein [Sabethes cyaneus]XP_053689454.1 unconventional prefoldin RPB5 interactor-like protein [Sabethes cyaneus]
MEMYNKVYTDALAGNEQESNRWRSYREELRQVKENIKFYQSQLKVDILIPIGSKALLPGQLYHTGEVMASHGCGYFSDCSVNEAMRIIDHRISNADSMLQKYDREKDLFVSKLEVPFAEDAFSGQEIIEEYDEEREKEWREQHRKRVRENKLQEAKSLVAFQPESESDESVFSRLEELELMEELEQEMDNLDVSVENDEQLRQLMSGELKVNEKKRLAHSLEPSSMPMDEIRKVTESLEIETTDDDGSSVDSEESCDVVSPEFAKLLQHTKSMDIKEKVEVFKEKLNDISTKLSQNTVTVDEKVDLCDLRYELEEALDFLCPAWESSEKLAKKKRTIKFAETDSVKIIENSEVQSSVGPSPSPSSKLTLELHVNHSPVQSQHSSGSNNERAIVSPADIYRLFEHCLAKEGSSVTSGTKTKSILKNREKVLEEIHHEEAPPLARSSPKKEPVLVDIIGEVIEHSSEDLREAELKTSASKTSTTGKKKVSRFKQQRS